MPGPRQDWACYVVSPHWHLLITFALSDASVSLLGVAACPSCPSRPSCPSSATAILEDSSLGVLSLAYTYARACVRLRERPVQLAQGLFSLPFTFLYRGLSFLKNSATPIDFFDEMLYNALPKNRYRECFCKK